MIHESLVLVCLDIASIQKSNSTWPFPHWRLAPPDPPSERIIPLFPFNFQLFPTYHAKLQLLPFVPRDRVHQTAPWLLWYQPLPLVPALLETLLICQWIYTRVISFTPMKYKIPSHQVVHLPLFLLYLHQILEAHAHPEISMIMAACFQYFSFFHIFTVLNYLLFCD